MRRLLLLVAFFQTISQAADSARVEVNFGQTVGPMKMNQMALGQGGLSSEPMFGDRIGELRALRPKVIRLFIQEYFNLLPAPGRYNFSKLDPAVDAILATGAKPLMCICFKPRLLFPEIRQDLVEPNDYAAWQALIAALVTHYKERASGIQYWEVANEPDIGEDGGSPYRFQPLSYVRYYKNTADAILGADPAAHVGGPALANVRSPILPALIDFCAQNSTPLHFVSWHIYSSDPKAIRGTIEYVKQQLQGHPLLKPETFLDEWNMDLTNPPLDPRFQPCYIAETIFQMKDAGLDYSCYYHIRDWHVSFEEFAPFMSPQGNAFMTRWWNRMPQFDGLFDYQNRVRPSYFAFKLLSRISGNRLAVQSDHRAVRALAAYDPQLRMHNLVLWNFSGMEVNLELVLKGLPADVRTRHVQLDALAPNDDENVRLRPDPFQKIPKGDQTLELQLAPFAIHYWSIE
ncbi:MAG: putative Xylan 1,4-beta-xylosidase [Verrucomicrobiales bacterium]|nr:putative Xylan 1,4-beta-xylosidase [Verrucomicrobiales bacterium]